MTNKLSVLAMKQLFDNLTFDDQQEFLKIVNKPTEINLLTCSKVLCEYLYKVIV